MPKPFPLPFTVGIDICSIPRIFQIIQRGEGRRAQKFLRKILTKEEIREDQKNNVQLSDRIQRWRNACSAFIGLEDKGKALGIPAMVFRYPFASPWQNPDSLTAPQQVKLRGLGWKPYNFALLMAGEPFSTAVAEDGIQLPSRGYSEKLLGEPRRASDWLFKPYGSLEEAGVAEHAPQSPQAESDSAECVDEEERNIFRQAFWSYQRDLTEADRLLCGAAKHLAGRFAAKEAIMKALPKRRLLFHDIIIKAPPALNTGSQKPIAVVLPPSRIYEDGQEVLLSISHDGDYATAACIAPITYDEKNTNFSSATTAPRKVASPAVEEIVSLTSNHPAKISSPRVEVKASTTSKRVRKRLRSKIKKEASIASSRSRSVVIPRPRKRNSPFVGWRERRIKEMHKDYQLIDEDFKMAAEFESSVSNIFPKPPGS